jgi:hypothetical protein
MATVFRHLLVPAVLILSLFAGSARADRQPFLLVTRGGTPGFKHRDVFYQIGMLAADFRTRFGEPDKVDEVGTLLYNGDGFSVGVKDGRIDLFQFYLVPADYSEFGLGKFEAAFARTDTGIKEGSKYREVIHSHGTPLNDHEDAGERKVEYPFGYFMFRDSGLIIVTLRHST